MHLPTRLQGRAFGPEELRQIQALIGQSGQWSRFRLSRELASLWNWRTPQGQLNDMAARTLLLKLQEQGWVRLPEPRIKSPTRSGRAPAAVTSALDESPLESVLPELVPLRLHEVSRADRREPRRQLEAALHQPHYLKQLTHFKSLTRPSPPTVSETVSYPPQPPPPRFILPSHHHETIQHKDTKPKTLGAIGWIGQKG